MLPSSIIGLGICKYSPTLKYTSLQHRVLFPSRRLRHFLLFASYLNRVPVPYQFPPGINKRNTESDVDRNRAPCLQSWAVAGKQTAASADDAPGRKGQMKLHRERLLQLMRKGVEKKKQRMKKSDAQMRRALDGWGGKTPKSLLPRRYSRPLTDEGRCTSEKCLRWDRSQKCLLSFSLSSFILVLNGKKHIFSVFFILLLESLFKLFIDHYLVA